MNVSDVIILHITKQDIFLAIQKAINVIKGTDFLDNLRDRDPLVSFDSKVRGYIGEIAITKYLSDNGITAKSVPYKGYGADIDLKIYETNETVEVKTSLRPDNWSSGNNQVLIQDCINNGDIKIYYVKNDLNASIQKDVYIQIYYTNKRTKNDEYLKELTSLGFVSVLNSSIENIYQCLKYYEYLEGVFFVGWNTKEGILEYLESLPVEQRTYSFHGSKQLFLYAPIKKARLPKELLSYFKAGDKK